MAGYQNQADRAITRASEDVFDREPFVRRLSASLISHEGRATGGVVGLIGEWGTGKSSILNLIKNHLDETYPQSLVVTFSPWLITTREELITAFFKELITSLDRKFGRQGEPYATQFSQLVDETIEALRKYGNALSPLASKIPKVGFFANSIFTLVEKIGADRDSLAHKKEVLEQKLRAIDRPIIVIIDELDRVDDDEVRSMAQLVRSVMDFPEISYLLAYDEARVTEALGSSARDKTQAHERGRKYLEKIVQLQVRVPPLLEGELQNLAFGEIEKILVRENLALRDLGKKRMEQLIKKTVPGFLTTYRSLKRVVSDFSLRMPMVANEVTPTDVLGFIILDALSPNSVTEIYRNSETMVLDSRDYEGLVRFYADESDKIENWIKEHDDKNDNRDLVKWLIAFLFPMLKKKHSDADSEPDDIAYRRPLRTLLRLSPTVGTITKQDLITFSRMSFEEMDFFIQEKIKQGNFDALIQRLREAYDDLELDHPRVWLLLCKVAESSDLDGSLMRQPLARSYADELADTLIYLAQRIPALTLALSDIFALLIKQRIICVAIIALRRIGAPRNASGLSRKLLTPTELNTASVGIQSILRHLINEKGYKGVRDVAAFYFLKDFHSWSNTDRNAYTSEIEHDPSTLDQFVISLFGGHYAADRNGIDALVEYSAFEKAFIQRLPNIQQANSNPALATAYQKAVSYLDLDIPPSSGRSTQEE